MNQLSNFLKTHAGKIPPLYIIIDRGTCIQKGIESRMVLDVCLEEGIRLFQYRDKSSSPEFRRRDLDLFLRDLSLPEDSCLVLNDDWQFALEKNLPVHLGQVDIPESEVLKRIVEGVGYGASSHNPEEWDRLRSLSDRGIGSAYTAFGAIFPSTTKPDVKPAFEELDEFYKNNFSEFSVLIGGISQKNIHNLLEYFQNEKNYFRKTTFFALIGGIFENGSGKSEIRICLQEILNTVSL